MATTVPTVKIKSDDTEAGYIIINEYDFNPEVHIKYREPSSSASATKKARKTGSADSKSKN